MFKKIIYNTNDKISINYDDLRHTKLWITDEEQFCYDSYSVIDFIDNFNEEQFFGDNPDRFKIFLNRETAKEYIELRELQAENERKMQYVN
tara:strand:- start:267 stop:539 length:273 start_codon:yes stop_codon:yes gene_type:complete